MSALVTRRSALSTIASAAAVVAGAGAAVAVAPVPGGGPGPLQRLAAEYWAVEKAFEGHTTDEEGEALCDRLKVVDNGMLEHGPAATDPNEVCALLGVAIHDFERFHGPVGEFTDKGEEMVFVAMQAALRVLSAAGSGGRRA